MAKRIVTVNDIAKLSVGLNLSRGDSSYPPCALYSLKDLESDLEGSSPGNPVTNASISNDYYVTKENDIVMNLTTKTCAIVGNENQGKILKNAFVKITLNEELIDPWYFCYAINSSNLFKKSISTEVLTAVRPLTISILGNASIELPSRKNQTAIGLIYKDICKLNYLNKKKQLFLSQSLNKITETI